MNQGRRLVASARLSGWASVGCRSTGGPRDGERAADAVYRGEHAAERHGNPDEGGVTTVAPFCPAPDQSGLIPAAFTSSVQLAVSRSTRAFKVAGFSNRAKAPASSARFATAGSASTASASRA